MANLAKELFFSKQFLVSFEAVPGFFDLPHLAGWQQRTLTGGQTLYHHPKLAVSQAAINTCEIICLGEILDPEHPEADNDSVTLRLARVTNDFDDLEASLARMGGRWVVIAHLGEAAFVYHDAAGLKTVFLYTEPRGGKRYIASQPALLDHLFSLERVPERDQEIRRLGVPQWPPYVYPYRNIVQLLSNHRLNLTDYSLERYWPKGDIAAVELDEAAFEILTYVDRIAQAAINRRQCHVSLTGGYDSRLLLAATLPLKDRIRYFTLTRLGLPRHDRIIPPKLARACQLDYRQVELAARDAKLLKVLDDNSSHMCLEHSRANAGTLAGVVDGGFFLQGTVSEQMRCLYYKDGHPPVTSLAELCRRTKFSNSALGREGLAQWLQGAPETNLEPLEVLYSELKLGIWASTLMTYKEAVVDIIPPTNCRHLLEVGLGVDVVHRARPHQLFRRMYEMADKKLLRWDINTTRRAELLADAKKAVPLPWRVKRALGFV